MRHPVNCICQSPFILVITVLFLAVIVVSPLTFAQEEPSSPGTVEIRSRPDSCLVSVDGVRIGYSPVRANLPAGHHHLLLSREGYIPSSDSITILPGQSLLIVDSLFLPSIVSLFTRPGGARIQVDGAFVGRTPIDSLPLSGGSHVLQAELPEYAPLSIRHVVPPGRRDTVWLELASSLSLLSLVTTPEHSTVSIDGGEPLMCPLWRHQVSEGLHVLSIHLPDLDTPVLRDIYVVSGYQVNVEAGGTVFSPGTMLTSLLVPGLGQIIERSYLKGALELAFAAGSIVFLSESVSYRNEKNSQFELTKSQYRVASTEQAAILARTNLELAASSLNRANDRLAVARIIVAGAYALSLVDALLNYTFRRDIVTVKSSEIRRELSVTLTFPF